MTNNTSDPEISQFHNEDITVSQQKWSTPKKLITLFVLSYIFFYVFPFPLDIIPYVNEIAIFYLKAIEILILFFSRNVLRITFANTELIGTVDTTIHFVKIITDSLFSIISTAVIFVFTRQQKNYSRLYSYMTVYARYFLAFYMLSYGFSKLIGGQFLSPDLNQLEQSLGSSSPMNLYWMFMGYSRTYTIFAGFCEVLGGTLLFFKRTTIIGCIVTIVVMLNTVFLNFSYDLPLKLFSIHQLLIALFIISPYLKKLTDLFIFQRNSILLFKSAEFNKKWTRNTGIIIKALFIICFSAYMINERVQMVNKYAAEYRIDGMYITQSFYRSITPDISAAKNKDTLVSADLAGWNRITFQFGTARIYTDSDYPVTYRYRIDTLKHLLTLSTINLLSVDFTLNCKFPNDNLMVLSGKYIGDSVYAVMKKKNLNEYTLMNNGFHWIYEYPYNK